MHVDNVTSVAARMPSPAVSQRVFIISLGQLLNSVDLTDSRRSEILKMVSAVNDVLPKTVSANGIASALLSLLSEGHSVQKLQATIRLLAQQLGRAFDGLKIQEGIASSKDPESFDNVDFQKQKARLMFQCVTLLVPESGGVRNGSGSTMDVDSEEGGEEGSLKESLMRAKKCFLKWFCSEQGPCLHESKDDETASTPTKKQKYHIVGAGVPDYTSKLDGLSEQKSPPWLDFLRCLLFLEKADSPAMESFFHETPSKVDDGWEKEKSRITKCSILAGDVDDEIIEIVLDSVAVADGGIPPKVGLTILEHLFERCRKDSHGNLLVHKTDLIWRLYDLVEYSPPPPIKEAKVEGSEENNDEANSDIVIPK